MRLLGLACLIAFAVVVCRVHAFASPPDNTKPILDVILTNDLCPLQSQQPYNDPAAGVDFLSENELVVYSVCHTPGALAERGGLQPTDPNHLKAVVIDVAAGTVQQRFDWLTRGRGSMLRVTHGGHLLLKVDNVVQILKPDKTPIAGLKIPKVSPTDLVWAATSPAVDALAVTLSSSAPDNKTVNGVAILDSRNLQAIARWHEDGEWWNLAASPNSVTRTVNDGTRVEFQKLESVTQGAPQWTAAWSGSKIPARPVFVSDSIFAFPAEDSVVLFDEGETKLAKARCANFVDPLISHDYVLRPPRPGRIAISRNGQVLGAVCLQASPETPTGWIARAEVYWVQPFRGVDSFALEGITLSSDLALSPHGSALAFIDNLRLRVFAVAPPFTGNEGGGRQDRVNDTVAAPAARPPRNSPKSESTATFRATARLVTVDVVATNGKGEFIRDLKPEDFTIREDGKVQTISSLNAHIRDGHDSTPQVLSGVKPSPLLQNQYTNIAARDPAQPVMMILFDLLNTATLDQVRARRQMVKFLQDLPPGQKVALFALSSRLSLIQGFSGDSDTLTKAANLILSDRVQPFAPASEADLQQAQVRADLQKYRGDQTAQKIADMMSDEVRAIRGMNACTTLDAIKSLARAASGYPGRKTLIWLSADFPLPVHEDDPRGKALSPCQTKIREAMHQMSAAEIAVYPVAVQGLTTGGIAISAQSGPPDSLQEETSKAHARQTLNQWELQEIMDDLAWETGGRAFYGTNDLQFAMARALQHGRNFYTLTYVPSKTDWNGRYRKIEVKLARPGSTLNYRRGYYALARHELSDKQAAQLLSEAMIPALPESTMLPLRVRVLPPDKQRKTVAIDYQLDAHDLSFAESPENLHRATIDLMATAWDSKYQDAGHVSNTLEMSLRPETYKSALVNGVTAHDEFQLKPGTYTLRVGVIDRASQKIGTVDVPLTVPDH